MGVISAECIISLLQFNQSLYTGVGLSIFSSSIALQRSGSKNMARFFAKFIHRLLLVLNCLIIYNACVEI